METYVTKPHYVLAERLTIANVATVKAWIQGELFAPGVTITDLGIILDRTSTRTLVPWGSYVIYDPEDGFRAVSEYTLNKLFERKLPE